jgi:hypothetical protein
MSRDLKPVDRLGTDLLWGVDGEDGIAAFLNIKPARAYYLIERGAIPVKNTSFPISRRGLASSQRTYFRFHRQTTISPRR